MLEEVEQVSREIPTQPRESEERVVVEAGHAEVLLSGRCSDDGLLLEVRADGVRLGLQGSGGEGCLEGGSRVVLLLVHWWLCLGPTLALLLPCELRRAEYRPACARQLYPRGSHNNNHHSLGLLDAPPGPTHRLLAHNWCGGAAGNTSPASARVVHMFPAAGTHMIFFSSQRGHEPGGSTGLYQQHISTYARSGEPPEDSLAEDPAQFT